MHAQAAGVNASSCTVSCRLAVGGRLGLADEDRERYARCATGSSTASNTADCIVEEGSCYMCYCYKALMAGMVGCATDHPSLF